MRTDGFPNPPKLQHPSEVPDRQCLARRTFVALVVAVQVGLVFNPQFTKDKCAALLKKLDGDGDGKVELDEWLTFFGLFLPALPPAKAKAGIAQLLGKTK